MHCPDYLRLQQRYEAALRNWVQSVPLFGQTTYQIMQARQKALDESNEAKDRVWVHEQSCSICLRKLASIPPDKAVSA